MSFGNSGGGDRGANRNSANALGRSDRCRELHLVTYRGAPLRDNSNYKVVEYHPLSAEVQAADILEDATVKLGKTSKTDSRPVHPIRLITIKTTPHLKRGMYKGIQLRLAVTACWGLRHLLDVSAEIMALICRYRCTIENFRFFKHVLVLSAPV